LADKAPLGAVLKARPFRAMRADKRRAQARAC
jgi:hypothetical protein